MTVEPYYDPEIRAAIEAGPRLGTINARTLDKVRADRLLLNDQVPLSDQVTRTDHVVPGPDGAPDIRLRVHRPRRCRGAVAVHVLDPRWWLRARLAGAGRPSLRPLVPAVRPHRRGGAVPPRPGASVPGRRRGLLRRPEVGEGARRGDRRRHVAGRHRRPERRWGLAAALALVVRDRAEVDIDYQLLIYPMIDDTRTSATAGWDVPVWNPASNEFGWASYLGDLFDGDDVPPHAAPSRATDLSGLPPTYIMVGTLDGFADEDIDYARRLNHAGVPVELHVYPGAPHGFEGFARARRCPVRPGARHQRMAGRPPRRARAPI